MDLLGMSVAKNRREWKITVLYRQGGQWHSGEVDRLVIELKTVASQHPRLPEYVLLYGHFSKEETLAAILGGAAYTANQVVGMDNEELPFTPSFL